MAAADAAAGEAVTPALLLDRFDPGALPREPWILTPDNAGWMSW